MRTRKKMRLQFSLCLMVIVRVASVKILRTSGDLKSIRRNSRAEVHVELGGKTMVQKIL